MQRTVKATRVTLAKAVIENGQLTTKQFEIVLDTHNDNNIEYTLKKRYAGCVVVSMEKFSGLYVLDDKIFFKYATKVK